MFHAADKLSETDINRVFNLYVCNFFSQTQPTTSQNRPHLLFSYSFAKDEFRCKGVFDLISLQDKFDDIDKSEAFDRLVDELDITPENAADKRYVCIFIYALDGLFYAAWYQFDRD